jgi:hypothetical protein
MDSINAWFSRLLEGLSLSRAIEQIETAVRSPGEHRTLAVMLLAAVAVAVVLLIIFLLILVTPAKKKVVRTRTYTSVPPHAGGEATAPSQGTIPPSGEAAPPAAPAAQTQLTKKPGRVFLALTGVPMVVGLVVLALAGVYAVTSTDYYCARTCHSDNQASTQPEVAHARCTACHEAPLVRGAPVNALTRARMTWHAIRGASPASSSRPVDSSNCEHCHEDIRDKKTAGNGGLVVSHKGIVAGGSPCTSCHERAGHQPSSETIEMSDCIGCHDSRLASAECTVCHSQDPTTAQLNGAPSDAITTAGGLRYPAVRAAKRNCDACHDMTAECDWCHGIRLPHSSAFKEGGHARAAAFDLKLQCGTCHDPSECGSCHSAFNPTDGRSSHAGDWKREHTTASWDAGCGCHSGRSSRDYPICFRCHEDDHSLKAVEP